ncbi:hypothetical protein LDV99_004501 [Vibrio parahaemolyticus]|nr:hypothetical protein [Vibrio parahaemolyticus]
MSHINISLGANTANYVQRLRDAKTETDRNLIRMEQRIDKFATQVSKDFSSVDGAINSMLQGMRGVKGGGYIAALTAVAFAVGSVSSSFHQLASQALVNEQALRKAATQANMTMQEFKVLALATSTVGVSMDDLGQMSKDVMDRIGDYATTGGGALQDFFDVVGEGKVNFNDLKNLDAPEFLQRVVTEMERAGASGAQMTFVLESIASESSNLLPLLVNNGEAMKAMQQRMGEIAATPLMNKDTIVEMQVMEANWSTMWDTFGVVAAHKLTGLYEMINGLLSRANQFLISLNVGDRADAIRDSLNNGKGYKADVSLSVGSLEVDKAALSKVLTENTEKQARLERDITNLKKNTTNYSMNQIVTKQVEIDKLERQNQLLKEQESILDAAIKKNKDAELKQLEESKKSNPAGSNPSQVREKNNLQASVDSATDELDRIKAVEALRVAEINQMKIDESEKLKLIEKAAKDRKDAELKHLQELEMKKAQLRVAAATTEHERLDAQYALEQAKLAQQFEKELVSFKDQKAMLFNAEYEHIQAKNELEAERVANQEESKIYEAESNLEFLKAQLEARNITQAEYDALALEHELQIAEARKAIAHQNLDMTSQMFEALGGVMKEGSKAQRAMLIAEKSATIASLGMKMWDAWGAVDKDPTMITQAQKLGAKALVLAQYGGAIAKVGSTAIGQAHSGMDEIDTTGSYILKQGERVIQPEANKDLTSYLKANKNNSNSSSVINSDLVIQGDTTISDEKFMYMLAQHRENLAQLVAMAHRENPSI